MLIWLIMPIWVWWPKLNVNRIFRKRVNFNVEWKWKAEFKSKNKMVSGRLRLIFIISWRKCLIKIKLEFITGLKWKRKSKRFKKIIRSNIGGIIVKTKRNWLTKTESLDVWKLTNKIRRFIGKNNLTRK